MSIVCKMFGHRASAGQKWAAGSGLRDGNGVWMPLRGFCPRCYASVDVGEIYLDLRQLREAVKKATPA